MKPFKRADRISSEIYHVIAETLYNELSDPRLAGVQITKASMTDDLQIMRVYYYLDGSADQRKRCLKGLNNVKGYLRRVISERLDLRLVPEINFFFDEGIEKAEKLDKLLNQIKHENGGE